MADIVRKRISSKFVKVENESSRATLECGHAIDLEKIEGKFFNILSGTLHKGEWKDWSGDEALIGGETCCYKCTSSAYKKELAARPAEKAVRFDNRDDLDRAFPSKKWHEWGPIHRHGTKDFVQVYLGQHEWLSVNVDDVREVYYDPGWEGTEYGFAFVDEKHIRYAQDSGTIPKHDISEPVRAGKPITFDAWAFGEPEKVKNYLGPEDPLSKAIDKVGK